ncbi:MAG: SMP-30/gluconolactonase/LRE family protein, partial [Deltaproteobacteria bacterium]|nr:SMP-30/gluconolactonase/LRE family protein [Deltaproteobacteria bacterium]
IEDLYNHGEEYFYNRYKKEIEELIKSGNEAQKKWCMEFINKMNLADNCKSSGDLNFICGPINAEDILPIGDTEWLLTTGLNGRFSGTVNPGHIYLVNRKDKTYEEIFPGKNPAFNPDKKLFSTCPGPIDIDKFSSHGLAIKQKSANRFHLYITGHAAREAIEVFEINIKDEKPDISWIGCVPLPKDMYANSVAILDDGGFVVTKFYDPAMPDPFKEIFSGQITGGIYEWHPGGIVKEIPGTELSGANGIAISSDDKWVYVAATGTREIVRFDRTQNPVALKKVQLNIKPDNIHWGDDGMLYTAGDNYVAPDECKKPPCETGWSVIRINPETMEAKRITGMDETAAMQRVSVATPVGKEIWIGTYAGDRIGYLLMD